MKKYTLFAFFSLITTFLNAQITLTSATNTPQVGDTYTYIVNPDYMFDVSQSGPNQSWDFSSASGSSELYSFIDKSSASQAATFPLSNLVSIWTYNNAEGYLTSSASEIAILGTYASGTGTVIYTDKQEYLKFPISYNDVFNETFSGTVENEASQTFDRSGNIQIMADGYGDLILPYTTINNVLRIKVTNTYRDTFMGFELPLLNDVIYIWYDAFNKSYLASATKLYYDGSLAASYATYLAESDLILGVKDSSFAKNQLSVFPNPAEDYCVIKNSSYDLISASIYDLRGSLIKTITIENGENKIETSNLLSGVYLIKYQKGAEFYVNRLMVK